MLSRLTSSVSRRRLLLVAAAALPMALVGATTATAAPTAKIHPRVHLMINIDQDAGVPESFSWTAKGLPTNSQLLLQRQVGTSGHWTTVKRLHTHTGNGLAPALPLGSDRYRLVVTQRNHILAVAARPVHVFGTVGLAPLFDRSVTTTAIGDHSFSTLEDSNMGYLVAAADNTCRSVHIDWGVDGSYLGYGTLALVQQSADPVVSNSDDGVISSFDATLTPGQSWSLEWQDPGSNANGINGYASCYSPHVEANWAN